MGLKTTKKQFEEFKAEAMRYMLMLSMGDWKVYFECKRLNSVAMVLFNAESCSATFSLCDEYDKADMFVPKETARHEVWHLFHARLVDLAGLRYVNKDEILNCAERMARILTEYELVPCSKS